jgi:hypothetical protein
MPSKSVQSFWADRETEPQRHLRTPRLGDIIDAQAGGGTRIDPLVVGEKSGKVPLRFQLIESS